jgi:N-acyl-D-amino-acid deacylase
MTGLTARNFRIEGRGLLRPGLFADVVVFDPRRVADTATYDQPISPSVGIEAVWVNGVRSFGADEGAVMARAGRMLTRGVAA